MMLIGRVYCPTCRTHWQYTAPEPPVECPKGHSAYPSAGYDDHPHEGDLPSRPSPDPAHRPETAQIAEGGTRGDCWYCAKPGHVYRHSGGYNVAMCDGCRDGAIPSPDPALARYEAALQEIVELDFAKDAHGRDDFYSGAPRFVRAWHIANDALREGSGPTPAERSLRVPHNPPQADPALARVRALLKEWRYERAAWAKVQLKDAADVAYANGRSDALDALAAALEGAATPTKEG